MKVGINNKPLPKPLPLSDAAIGGIASGASGVLGSIIDSISGAVNAKKQRQHDKDMAALNQQNILEQMEVQNQYQIDQWNRENAYNDPSAVAERYREAGINPRAAFGQGSAGGAGIAGGLSSAPSGSNTGSASNIMFDTDFGGIVGDALAGARLQAQNKKDLADAERAAANAKREWLAIEKEEFQKKNGVWSAEVLQSVSDANKAKAEASIAAYNEAAEAARSIYYDAIAAADAKTRFEKYKLAQAEVAKANQERENLVKLGGKIDAETGLVNAQTLIADADKRLREQQIAKELELIENLKADRDLTKEQTRKVAHEVIQGYAKLGIDAVATLNDVLSTWIPNPGTMTKKITQMFDKKGKSKGSVIETTNQKPNKR